LIDSNSYENLFSPDSNFVLTASHDSHESLS